MSYVQRGHSYWKFNDSLLHDQIFSYNWINFFKHLKTFMLMNKWNGICVKLKSDNFVFNTAIARKEGSEVDT